MYIVYAVICMLNSDYWCSDDVSVNDATSEAPRGSLCSLTGTVIGFCLWARTFTWPSWVLLSNFFSKPQKMMMWKTGWHTQTQAQVYLLFSVVEGIIRLNRLLWHMKCTVPGGVFYKCLKFLIDSLLTTSHHPTIPAKHTANWHFLLSDSLSGTLDRSNSPANSAFHPSGVGKWVPASAGKAKAGIVHSFSGCSWSVRVKLWDPLRTRAIPEHLRGVFMTRRYKNICRRFAEEPSLKFRVKDWTSKRRCKWWSWRWWRRWCRSQWLTMATRHCCGVFRDFTSRCSPEESGGTPETETCQKNSNIIYKHAKCKYRNKLLVLFAFATILCGE